METMKHLGTILKNGIPTFDQFYAEYPKKTDKAEASKLWDKLTDSDKFAAYTGTIHHRENNPEWQRGKNFIPNPARFLRRKKWQDETVKTAKDEVIENQGDSKADAVWSAMTQMYGETWINKFGPKPLPVWRSQLEPMSIEQIKRGLKMVKDGGFEFPPGLPKFVELCRIHAPLEPFKMLPRPDGDPAKADDAFAELRRILK